MLVVEEELEEFFVTLGERAGKQDECLIAGLFCTARSRDSSSTLQQVEWQKEMWGSGPFRSRQLPARHQRPGFVVYWLLQDCRPVTVGILPAVTGRQREGRRLLITAFSPSLSFSLCFVKNDSTMKRSRVWGGACLSGFSSGWICIWCCAPLGRIARPGALPPPNLSLEKRRRPWRQVGGQWGAVTTWQGATPILGAHWIGEAYRGIGPLPPTPTSPWRRSPSRQGRAHQMRCGWRRS